MSAPAAPASAAAARNVAAAMGNSRIPTIRAASGFCDMARRAFPNLVAFRNTPARSNRNPVTAMTKAWWYVTTTPWTVSLPSPKGDWRSRNSPQEAHGAGPGHGQGEGGEVGEVEEARRREAGVGAQHVEGSLGEVGDAHDAEDEGEAQCHEQVEAAQEDPVREELGEEAWAHLAGARRSGRAPTGRGPAASARRAGSRRSPGR